MAEKLQSGQRKPSKAKMQRNYSTLLTRAEGKKRPYKMQCKNGPGCRNHDWSAKSPVRLVCKNGPGCGKHDWGSDRNPLAIKCFLGDQDCRHHNWNGFLTRHSIDMCDKEPKKKRRVKKQSVVVVERPPVPQPPEPQPTPIVVKPAEPKIIKKIVKVEKKQKEECYCAVNHSMENYYQL